MRIYYVLTSLFMLFSVPLCAAEISTPALSGSASEPSAGLSLDVAISLALQANPELAIAISERDAVKGMQIQAATVPNPSLSTYIEDTRSSTRQTTIEVSQPFELGGKRAARVAAADVRYAVASTLIELKRAEIRAATMKAFYEVLIAQEHMALSQSLLELAQRVQSAASKRVKAGKISPVEEIKSKVAESTVKIELSQMAAQLATSRIKLSGFWGASLPRFSMVVGQLDLFPVVPQLAELHARQESSPAIKLAKLEIEQRESLVNIEDSKRTPDLTLSVGARRNEELGLNQAIIGLSIPIPVYDRNQGNLQEALSRTNKARDELLAIRVQQGTLLSAAFERYLVAKLEANILQADILPSAQSAYDSAVKGFEFGKFGFLDVLDAQRTLFYARSQYLNALLNGHLAIADIHGIMGNAFNSGDTSITAPRQE